MSLLSEEVEGLFCTLAIVVDAALVNAQNSGKDLREKQNCNCFQQLFKVGKR